MLPFILTSFRGAVCSLPIGGFLCLTNHLAPFLLAAYCPKKACALTLPSQRALPLPSQRAVFAIAVRCLCHCSALRRVMQYDPLRFLPFQPCRGWTLLLSSRSVPLLQEPFSFLLFGTLAIPPIPHWFKFAMVCISQTGLLLLFGHHFGIFIPVGCVKSMRKHHFCPQKPYLGDKKRL